MTTCHSVSSGLVRGGDHRAVHARRLAWPGCGRPSTPAWRRPASGQPWPLVSRPSSSSWPPSRSRCWYPATARRAARARRPTRRRAIRQERRERRSRRRGRTRPRCLQPPRRRLTRLRRLRLRIPPRLRRSPPRLRPVPRRAAHPDTQGITAAEPGNLMQRPTAPNTQICAPQETSAKSQAAAPNEGGYFAHAVDQLRSPSVIRSRAWVRPCRRLCAGQMLVRAWPAGVRIHQVRAVVITGDRLTHCWLVAGWRIRWGGPPRYWLPPVTDGPAAWRARLPGRSPAGFRCA